MRRYPAAICAPAAHAAVSVLLLLPALAAAQAVAIDCDLTGPKGHHFGYSFDYVPSRGSLALAGGSGELKTERHTASELLASYRGRLDDPAAGVAYFRINLTTGAAQVTYVHEPTPAEVEKCQKERTFGCQDPVVLAEDNEIGQCSMTEQPSR